METRILQATAAQLEALQESRFPLAVASDGDFEDWNVIGPGLLGVSLDLGIALMREPRRHPADVLSRSLAEYVITFAYLAGSEGEERTARLAAWHQAEWLERSKDHNAYGALWRRRRYREFKKTRPGVFPNQLLGATARQQIAHHRNRQVDPLPNVADQAEAADEMWWDRIGYVRFNPFAVMYQLMFRNGSSVTHASIMAVQRFVLTGGDGTVTIGPRPMREDGADPQGYGFVSLMNALFVSSIALGWPTGEEVNRIVQTVEDQLGS